MREIARGVATSEYAHPTCRVEMTEVSAEARQHELRRTHHVKVPIIPLRFESRVVLGKELGRKDA